ncbi:MULTISPECIES: glycoside hydrolase family 172 protein [unclassified Lentimonas]|uniref:glycoside hydrolase family 172 protein n=1 Tax=unclassified Lentimonas TaxID=2630993 RepID=UPI001323BE63|nr:Unannotated [Lentimonas sp. CC4]CAA6684999.1 Unannotated [Lentimonas sp. CC6]CAA7077886.1 Unannotated [Lentimonas sp. CC4]CAA7169811.1 Unannotated [Lentimonas sp. CC21]CAA7179929.1 Unannotated [Lentimonas sp. CC8]
MKKSFILISGSILLLLGVACASNGGAPATKTVTIESLLHEMVDRDAVASFPEEDFRLKLASSYNRKSLTGPEDERGWFFNSDLNRSLKDGNFVRIEENNGREEVVLMDVAGPGAVVRSWIPWRSIGNPGRESLIWRVYIDGSDTPVIEGDQHELFQGKGLVPFPLAHESLRSAVSFFPIPYAKSCKITLEGVPFFYQIHYREYDKSVDVKSFTMEDFEAALPLTAKVGEQLLNPQVDTSGQAVSLETQLAQGEEKSVALPAGTAAVRHLSVKLGDYSDPEVTRKVILKINFDGKETVWCPIGDFFGSGIGLHPFQGWYRTVDEDGTMTARWVMPYKQAGSISILNLNEAPVDVTLNATVGDYEWTQDSLYFHAGWRGQYPVNTEPKSDWNYITTAGRGVLVGDTLTIMNPLDGWWGEGDEKIWTDGEAFPSNFGTGTEDYYAYSWGGSSTDFYDHPFHAQPRAHTFNKLNRKSKGDKVKTTKGYSTETRTRSLDTMPFSKSLKLDMEVWTKGQREMGYGVGVYWYGDASTTTNHKPEPTEVLNVPPLPDGM